MNKEDYNIRTTRSTFFGIIKKEEELDETQFNMWKSELEKELPSFWEQVNRRL